MTEAVFANGLSKRYGERLALDRLSLSLSPGSVFGFLGPNGAGKTTTVKLLTGLLTPTEGACSVFGLDPCREPEKVHALCGVVTESARLYPQLSGLENLSFFRGALRFAARRGPGARGVAAEAARPVGSRFPGGRSLFHRHGAAPFPGACAHGGAEAPVSR